MQSQAGELSLLDVPQPWLLKMMKQYLDSGSKLSLFQTCRQLNEMIMQHSQRTSLSLQPLARPVDAQVKALHTASRHAPCVRLVLGCSLMQWTQCVLEPGGLGQAVCSFLQAAHQQGATGCVTCLKLEQFAWNGFMAAAVKQACPNLTSLALRLCCITEEATAGISNAFPHLQSLELEDIRLRQEPLHTQLRGLTALKKLTIVHHSSMEAVSGHLIRAVTGPLTHLHVTPVTSALHIIQAIQTKFGVTLQHLRLGEAQVGDAAVKELLKLPCLTHVEAWVGLDTSFAGQPCKWQELTTFDIDLQTLAFLPLHSGLLVKAVRRSHRDAPRLLVMGKSLQDAMDMAQRAIINVKKGRGLQWGTPRGIPMSNSGSMQLALMVYDVDSVGFSELLVETLPLVSGAHELDVVHRNPYWDEDAEHHQHLTEDAVQALCSLVCHKKAAVCLNLQDCSLDVKHAVCLVRALPCSSTLKLCISTVHAEKMVLQLCSAAQCKLVLHVCSRGPHPEGYKELIMSAMQSCGHHHVELVVD